MKRALIVFLCLMLAICPINALGAVRMPQCRGTLTDDANVLSAQTAADLSEYAIRLEDETGIVLHVALVHFLDGAEVQSYANALFDLWALSSDHLLLLGAAGEDSYATAAGSSVARKLGASSAENLMFTTSFGSLFSTQQYDAAFAAYCAALNALVEKQTGETIRMDGLFGHTAPSPIQQAQSFGSELWSDIMDSISDSSENYQAHHLREEREDNGLSAGGWIVLIILVMIMLRRNKYERRKRPGCTGWILSLLGVNLLADLFRRRRH